MKHGSLFSGIGGFDLAASWMNWQNIWQVERDKRCQNILQQHFPDAIRHSDITTLQPTELDAVDIITGGFPCQPFSFAGKRLGSEDDRHLWPHMLKVCAALRSRWIVAENVPGLIKLGIDQVLADLENEDYEAGVLVLPAASLGAPHRRPRVWIIAHTDRFRKSQPEGAEPEIGGRIGQQDFQNATNSTGQQLETPYYGKARADYAGNPNPFVANADSFRFWSRSGRLQSNFEEVLQNAADPHRNRRSEDDSTERKTSSLRPDWFDPRWWRTDWYDVAAATCLRGVDDGVSSRVHDAKTAYQKEASETRQRSWRISALGNAVSPPLVYELFKMIEAIDRQFHPELY